MARIKLTINDANFLGALDGATFFQAHSVHALRMKRQGTLGYTFQTPTNSKYYKAGIALWKGLPLNVQNGWNAYAAGFHKVNKKTGAIVTELGIVAFVNCYTLVVKITPTAIFNTTPPTSGPFPNTAILTAFGVAGGIAYTASTSQPAGTTTDLGSTKLRSMHHRIYTGKVGSRGYQIMTPGLAYAEVQPDYGIYAPAWRLVEIATGVASPWNYAFPVQVTPPP